jgi:hypothetical protein
MKLLGKIITKKVQQPVKVKVTVPASYAKQKALMELSAVVEKNKK